MKKFELIREDIALAISSDKPTTLLVLIPAAGRNSYKVTTGPYLKLTIFPSTPYSLNIISSFFENS